MNKCFEIIEYGKTRSDETCEYKIQVAENVTVKDVITNIISNKNEWGRIGIKDDNHPFFGKYPISYKNGKFVDIDEKAQEYWNIIKDCKVVAMKGDGGWSCSDYQLILGD